MYFKLHEKIKFKNILKLRANVNMAARDTKTSGLEEIGMGTCLLHDYMCFKSERTDCLKRNVSHSSCCKSHTSCKGLELRSRVPKGQVTNFKINSFCGFKAWQWDISLLKKLSLFTCDSLIQKVNHSPFPQEHCYSYALLHLSYPTLMIKYKIEDF